jgi:hypothetical protein
MVRPLALLIAFATGPAGTALAARAQADSDVVRGEIEHDGLRALVTYCNHNGDVAQESSAEFGGLKSGRSARGE